MSLNSSSRTPQKSVSFYKHSILDFILISALCKIPVAVRASGRNSEFAPSKSVIEWLSLWLCSPYSAHSMQTSFLQVLQNSIKLFYACKSHRSLSIYIFSLSLSLSSDSLLSVYSFKFPMNSMTISLTGSSVGFFFSTSPQNGHWMPIFLSLREVAHIKHRVCPHCITRGFNLSLYFLLHT